MSSPSSFPRALILAVALLLNFQSGKAQLFNYTAALTGWGSDGSFGLWPSEQTNSTVPIVRKYMDTPAELGAIFYNSIAQNQSYAVAEVMRWLMRPAGLDPSVYPAASANLTDYNRVASNLGAAMAYAMQYAYQNTTMYTPVIGPPAANGVLLKSGTDNLVAVKPNATDVFYVAASALMGVVFNGCDANWRCHVGDCDNGDADIVRKRAGVCCPAVSPMLAALSRQLHLWGNDNLVDLAMPASMQAANPISLEFLARCNRQDVSDTSQTANSACNANTSTNYMGTTLLLDVNSNTPGAPPVASAQDCCLACLGNSKCNVWVYCAGEHGCGSCDNKALSYRAGAGSSGQTFGPYGRGCAVSDSDSSAMFPTGTCTLKAATFKTSPQAYPDENFPFTSGYITPHTTASQ